MDMDGGADEDHGHTDEEAGVGEVSGGVGVAGEAEVASVEVSVDGVEYDGGNHDEEGHLFAGGSDSEGEDEGPVDVVDDPYAGEDDEGGSVRVGRPQAKQRRNAVGETASIQIQPRRAGTLGPQPLRLWRP